MLWLSTQINTFIIILSWHITDYQDIYNTDETFTIIKLDVKVFYEIYWKHSFSI